MYVNTRSNEFGSMTASNAIWDHKKTYRAMQGHTGPYRAIQGHTGPYRACARGEKLAN